MQGLLWPILGALGPLMLPALPPAWLAAALLLLAGGLALTARLRAAALLPLAAAWTLFQLGQALETRLPEAPGEAVTLTGTVSDLPRGGPGFLEFPLRLDRGLEGLRAGAIIRVRWYRDAPRVRAGERWRLEARLRPPRGRVNFAGPDRERAYLSQRIAALASVTSTGGERLEAQAGDGPWLALRARLRERLRALLAGHPGAGLVLALAIADRGALDDSLRTALAVTGTGHLLAISGLHVGLVAAFALGLARAGFSALVALPGLARLRAWIFPASWLSSLAAAIVYAALAGFATSTRRALVMLTVLVLCRLSRRTPGAGRALGLALLAVLLLDPLAPLQAGFWLSFAAVGILVALFAPRLPPPGRPRSLLMAQLGITGLMLPLGMHLFGQAGVGGMLANLVAIPWVSAVTLPLTLAGLALLPLHADWAEVALAMAADSADRIAGLLLAAAGWLDGAFRLTHRPGLAATVLAMAGGALLLLPRACRLRWAGLLLIIPALAPAHRPLPAGAVELEVLDVGQGLAVLVRTHRHALLYDAGPGQPGHWDLHRGVIAPALAAAGHRRPDRVLISHGDLDHAGGLPSLRDAFGDPGINASLRRRPPGLAPCDERLSWRWDGVRFEVLHPSPFLPYLGNASSCVLGVRAAGGGLLLPGDIDAAVEGRLAARVPGDWPVLVAAHHGSRTSNSDSLLRWARPRQVLVSAGAGNAFGMPHPEVLDRLRGAGAVTWNTADCGGLRLRLEADGRLLARAARRARTAPWRWPAAPGCP